MLDSEYFVTLTEGAEKIAADMHTSILRRVIERLKARLYSGRFLLSSTDKRQLETLSEAGILMSEVQAEIAKATKLQKAEVAAMFEDAGIEEFQMAKEDYNRAGINVPGIRQSPAIVRILESAANSTEGEWQNMTKTTAISARDTFVREVDRAYNLVASGSATLDDAYTEAIDRLASQGVSIIYPSGKRDTIETATLRAMRTGLAQAAGTVTAQRAFENGVTCFLVSSHRGARPDHEVWQGKVYWIDWKKMPQGIQTKGETEKEKGFLKNFRSWLSGIKAGMDLPKATLEERRKYGEFVESTGYGEMLGLCGINCRHTFGPWFEGVSVNNMPQISKAENDELFRLQQKQRRMEREIRKVKREAASLSTAIEGLEDGEAKKKLSDRLDAKKKKLFELNTAYRKFCEENDLKPEETRLYIAKESRKARKKTA